MREWLKTSSGSYSLTFILTLVVWLLGGVGITSFGSYNLTFILTFVAWLLGGVGIIAGFHHNKVSNIEAENKAKEIQKNHEKTKEELEAARLKTKELEAQLTPLKAAVPARKITANQRDLFLEALACEENKSPKIPIKVLVTSDDSETKEFAKKIRALLDEAGYKTEEGKGIAKVSAPPASFLDNKQRIPDLIAVTSNAAGYSDMTCSGFGSIMIMNASPSQIAKGDKSHPRVYRYTKNPNDIIYGITAVLQHIGISTHAIFGDGVLQPGEVAFYVPSQMGRANP